MGTDLLNDPTIDWASCTYDGARLANHRLFVSLTFAEKLEAIEELNEFARHSMREKQRRGLPYFDPSTGQLVAPVPRR